MAPKSTARGRAVGEIQKTYEGEHRQTIEKMERHQGRHSTREDILHLWGSERPHQWLLDWWLPAILPLMVHITTPLLHADPILHLSQKRLPLLPSRPLLLRQLPLHVLHLVLPTLQTPLHLNLLPRLRKQRHCHSHVEKQHGLPQLRQSNQSIHPHHALRLPTRPRPSPSRRLARRAFPRYMDN